MAGKFLKNHSTTLLILGFLAGLYFAIRLPNLTYLPVFADEAIYIRWAQVMKAEPTLRFLPLMDGKTPLFMWLMVPFFKFFSDPLMAGRMLSVVSGIFTVLGIWFIGAKFINKRVGLWAAFLIVISPYFVFFDRMALVDSMLAAFSVWTIAVALLLVRNPRTDLAMILGYLMGGALLTKTPAFFTILTVPLTILTLNFNTTNWKKRGIQLILLWLIAILIGLFIYNLLRLGPGFSNLSSRNQDYVLSPMDIIYRPLDPFMPHLRDFGEFVAPLLGYVVLAFLVWGVYLAVKKRNVYLVALLAISWMPLLIEMAFLRTFTARYVLFPVTYLMVVAAFGIDDVVLKMSKKFNPWLVIGGIPILLFMWPSYFFYNLYFDLENAPLPRMERDGYLEQWTAGHGLKEIAAFLDEESKNDDIVVGTKGAFGTLPEGLQIYTNKNRRITVIAGGQSLPDNVKTAAKDHPTYYVANKVADEKFEKELEVIKEYPKIRSEDGRQQTTVLFKVLYREEISN